MSLCRVLFSWMLFCWMSFCVILCHSAECHSVSSCVILLYVMLLNVILLNVILLNHIVLNVIVINVILLNVIILNLFMLSLILLHVILLNVVAPQIFLCFWLNSNFDFDISPTCCSICNDSYFVILKRNSSVWPYFHSNDWATPALYNSVVELKQLLIKMRFKKKISYLINE